MGADLLRVRLDLGGVGVELVAGIGADTATRRASGFAALGGM
jgi:hypothetical protein